MTDLFVIFEFHTITTIATFVAAASAQRRKAQVAIDEFQERDVVGIAVRDMSSLRSLGSMAVPWVRIRHLGVALKLLDGFGRDWTRLFEPPVIGRERNEPDGQCAPPTIKVGHTLRSWSRSRQPPQPGQAP